MVLVLPTDPAGSRRHRHTGIAVERENRRHRQRQKTIHRARTRQTIAGRICFSMLCDLDPVALRSPKVPYRLPNPKPG